MKKLIIILIIIYIIVMLKLYITQTQLKNEENKLLMEEKNLFDKMNEIKLTGIEEKEIDKILNLNQDEKDKINIKEIIKSDKKFVIYSILVILFLFFIFSSIIVFLYFINNI
jgi:hypothetical protein